MKKQPWVKRKGVFFKPDDRTHENLQVIIASGKYGEGLCEVVSNLINAAASFEKPHPRDLATAQDMGDTSWR